MTINTPIYFDAIGFEKLNIFFKKYFFSKVFVLVDENTKTFCLHILKEKITNSFHLIEIRSGEQNKNIESCGYIWDELTTKGADRKSILINLGGGVITDMGGFAAATYKRGIPFINIPTTILGMVDAAVGGKTGVDLNGLKNQIGLFSNPEMILIHPTFLLTLPKRERISGLAEIIKYGLIDDPSIWRTISNKEFDITNIPDEIIKKSIKIKEGIVKKDPTEKGIRKTLNFGHTLGHAIETHYFLKTKKEQLLHGEAIAIGMILALHLSFLTNNMIIDLVNEISKNIKNIYSENIPSTISIRDISYIISLLQHDKKNLNGNTNFILLSQIGKPIFDCKVNKKQIIKSFEYYNNL